MDNEPQAHAGSVGCCVLAHKRRRPSSGVTASCDPRHRASLSILGTVRAVHEEGESKKLKDCSKWSRIQDDAIWSKYSILELS